MKPPLVRYKLVAPDGLTHTRRVRDGALWALYGKHSYDHAMAEATGPGARRRYGRRYDDLIASYDEHPAYRDSQLGGSKNAEEFIALRIAEDVADVEKARANGLYDRYCRLTWGKTREEATANLSRVYDYERYHELVVIEGVAVPPPPSGAEVRLQMALEGNPYAASSLHAEAWEQGVRHAFTVAYVIKRPAPRGAD